MSGPREVHAPRGDQLSCKNWIIEAAYRMIQNNLDPAVAGDSQRRHGQIELNEIPIPPPAANPHVSVVQSVDRRRLIVHCQRYALKPRRFAGSVQAASRLQLAAPIRDAEEQGELPRGRVRRSARRGCSCGCSRPER